MKVVLVLALIVGVAHCASVLNDIENLIEEVEEEPYNVPRGVVFFQVKVYQGFVIVKEEIEVDTIRNFVIVHTPSIGDFRSITIFHDYNRNQTLAVYPATNHCYFLDNYSDIPQDMAYWFRFRDETMKKKAFDGKNAARYKSHQYRVTERNVDRSALTERMKLFCTEGMELRRTRLLLENEMVRGSDEPEGQREDRHYVYMPYVPTPGGRRQKRLVEQLPTDDSLHCCDVEIDLGPLPLWWRL